MQFDYFIWALTPDIKYCEKQMKIDWVGWNITNLFYYGTRFNSGVPYKFIRIGPVMFRRYL